MTSACSGGPTTNPIPDGATEECIPTSSSDAPDVDGVDANCDGVDGDANDSVFVDATSGRDSNAGSKAAPVATVDRALEIAEASGKHAVLIATGQHVGAVHLRDGISLHGGYRVSEGWRRSPLDDLETVVTSDASPVFFGEALSATLSVTGIRIVAPTGPTHGASSYAVLLRDVTDIRFESAEVTSRDGAAGLSGADITLANTPGTMGAQGSPSRCFVLGTTSPGCSDVYYTPGGPGGMTTCSCANGGAGGNAGVGILSGTGSGIGGAGALTNVDGSCGVSPAAGASGSGGASAPQVGPGIAGTPGGTGAVGANGGAADALASFTDVGPTRVVGAPGTNGASGGGGGGGSGGPDHECPDLASPPNHTLIVIGSTGGSGGSGGCGGLGANGGESGGSSIAIYAVRSQVTFRRTTLECGAGGPGGAGGSGGPGGAGGPGMPAGPASTVCPTDGSRVARAGGPGGMGGSGGAGGAGGGAPGGSAIGIVLFDGSTISPDSVDVFFSPGTAGTGGASPGHPGANGRDCAVFEPGTNTCRMF